MPVYLNKPLFQNLPTSSLNSLLSRVFPHSVTTAFSSGIRTNALSFRFVCTVQRGRYKQCATIVRRREMSMTSPATTPHRSETTPSAPQKRSSIFCAFTRAKVKSVDFDWIACVDWVTPAVATMDLHGKMVVSCHALYWVKVGIRTTFSSVTKLSNSCFILGRYHITSIFQDKRPTWRERHLQALLCSSLALAPRHFSLMALLSPLRWVG